MSLNTNDDLLTINTVAAKLGLCRKSIYNHLHRGVMPAPVRVGPRLVRWRAGEIAAYIAGLPASGASAAHK